MKFFLSACLLLGSACCLAQTPAASKPVGVDVTKMDTTYFKNIVVGLVSDAEKGFPKTKGKDTIISGQKVWRANNGISGALMVRIRSVQNKPLYETVLYANPNSDEALATTVKLSSLVGRALGNDYLNQSRANVGSGNKGSVWQERFEPKSGSGKNARIVLVKAEAQGGQHTVTMSILGAH